MRASPKSPSYLVRNPYSYCFRMVVPKDLQKFVGKRELRYTLRTGYAGVARPKAQFVAGKVHFIFRSLRRGAGALEKLTNDKIKVLIDQYIKEAIQRWDEPFFEDVDKDEYPLPLGGTISCTDYTPNKHNNSKQQQLTKTFSV
jgi:hypothetical protein